MTGKTFAITSLTLLFSLLMVSFAFANTPINTWHHFGGDSLFCDETECRLLNATGNELWSVSQEDINTALDLSCETNTPQIVIEAPATYGPSILTATCNPTEMCGRRDLQLFGIDEHDKPNEMVFCEDFAPIVQPPHIYPTTVPTVAPFKGVA